MHFLLSYSRDVCRNPRRNVLHYQRFKRARKIVNYLDEGGGGGISVLLT